MTRGIRNSAILVGTLLLFALAVGVAGAQRGGERDEANTSRFQGAEQRPGERGQPGERGRS
jgi:hypothetical protein